MLFALFVAALSVTACEVDDPYSSAQRARSADSPLTRSTLGAPPRGDPAALATARAFATASTNWSWRTIADDFADQARLAGGALAKLLEHDRSFARRDAAVRRDRLENHGRVVAAQAASAQRRGRAKVVLVVLETTTSDGHESITSRAYHVYRATLVQRGARWRVTRWEALG